MNKLRERDERFVHLERRVGLFVLSAVTFMVLAMVFVGLQQGLFTPKTTVFFLDDSGKDLNVGMAVKLRGFKVGRVREVRLDDMGKVEVNLAINSDHMKWIRSDSVARLVKEMFIGDSTIEIIPGSPDRPRLEKNARISFEREVELGEVARNAMEEVKPVLLSIKNLIEYVDDPEGDFKSSIANINRLSGDLTVTRENVDRLTGRIGDGTTRIIESLEQIVEVLQSRIIPDFNSLVGQANRTMERTEKTIQSVETFVAEDLEEITRSLREEVLPELKALLVSTEEAVGDGGMTLETLKETFPELLERVAAILDNVSRITDDLKEFSAEVPGMARKGEDLLGESREMVRSIRNIWPLGSSPPPPVDERLEADSYEDSR